MELAEDYWFRLVSVPVDLFAIDSTHAFLGTSLFVLLEKAFPMRTKHTSLHTKLCLTFETALLAKWEQMVADWNIDTAKPNPYEEPVVHEWRDICSMAITNLQSRYIPRNCAT
jgi:hypothetical protein